MMAWGDTGDPGNYYGLGLWHFVIDEWDIPGLGEAIGHGGMFNSHTHYWPDQNVVIVGTLNSKIPQYGFVFQMLEAMGAIQAAATE